MTASDRSLTCKICGGEAEATTERENYAIGQRTVEIDREFVRCLECGEEYVTPDQMEGNQRKASRKIREREGLLQPWEIHRIRDGLYGLTQREFERLLGAGKKTVTRWENGSVFQNKTTDRLIRILGRHPEIVRELAREEGIDVPGLPAARSFSLTANYEGARDVGYYESSHAFLLGSGGSSLVDFVEQESSIALDLFDGAEWKRRFKAKTAKN